MEEKLSNSIIRKSKNGHVDDLEVHKEDKVNWVKTIEAIVLLFRLIRKFQGIPLVYVVRQNIKVVLNLPGYDAYLNFDKEMVATAPQLT